MLFDSTVLVGGPLDSPSPCYLKKISLKRKDRSVYFDNLEWNFCFRTYSLVFVAAPSI